MNSSIPPSDPPDPPDPADADKINPLPPQQSDKEETKWSLNRTAFDKLLSSLSSDRNEAALQYEMIRQRLVRFLEWNGVNCASDYADEALDRAARRIEQGKIIDNLLAYLIVIARYIVKEVHNHRGRVPISLDDIPVIPTQKEPELIDPDTRQLCFDRCLEDLNDENRGLILEYYEGTGGEKIIRRQRLADKFGIQMNALRIRVHRVRRSLESCIAQCLAVSTLRNN